MLKYLWEILTCAKEERTDGDAFQGDLFTAFNSFEQAMSGQKVFKTLNPVDLEAAKADWLELDEKEKYVQRNLVKDALKDIPKAALDAFQAGDKVAFIAALK